ncbi:conserved hypothetical protein [Gloeothece citriformis PCC 7424]|uniref:P pilus assembly/Cpx signaling pathway, periplasmic inhibitor/zinc-resistance associated protein n=1 Tax=Gloeothece citriformis (strain PCC 7424) TaxID=65393 RepID=B7KD20_GLOC7|nr:hypothetical protein [Gloeothece citriformis]ACK73141.1 conserved hypothetical protein [Gloeothece citriformis PCC 7424]
MTSKFLALLGTTVTLISFTGFPTPSQATPLLTDSTQSGLFAQGRPSKLDLTPEQIEQLREIRESTRTQIENILTQEQKNQLRTAKERGENRLQVWSSLNLTPQQQTQIQNIREDSQQKMEAILTPQQLQQLQQRRPNRPQS